MIFGFRALINKENVLYICIFLLRCTVLYDCVFKFFFNDQYFSLVFTDTEMASLAECDNVCERILKFDSR